MGAVPFISVCSGIEAASEAWNPLGAKAVLLSEVEAAPRAVLEFRHSARDVRHSNPNREGIPLWGDFTALRVRHLIRFGVALPAILVGGTPCQSFSIAGLRKSLADAHGNLTFAFVRLANAIDNARRGLGLPGLVIAWENVPGVLSTKDNAFGCFLAGLVGADAPIVPGKGQRWTRAGMVAGPRRRAAWIIKDAQYFGLAQRRERVFVVSSPLDGPDPSQILFEPEGMRRHFAPRRESGKDVTGTISARDKGGGGLGADFDLDGGLIAKCLSASHTASHTASGRQDPSAETFIAHPLRGQAQASHRADSDTYIAHTLCGEGFDASEDGTGRGVPLVVATLDANYGKLQGCSGQDLNHGHSHLIPFDTTQVTSKANRSVPKDGDPCHPLAAGAHAPAIAFNLRGREGGSQPEMSDVASLRAASGGSSRSYVANTLTSNTLSKGGISAGKTPGMVNPIFERSGVRRLMPSECEKLQGFAPDYTLVPYRGKPMADGPRYKMLGNSMAVPCMAWIGRRILASLDNREIAA